MNEWVESELRKMADFYVNEFHTIYTSTFREFTITYGHYFNANNYLLVVNLQYSYSINT